MPRFSSCPPRRPAIRRQLLPHVPLDQLCHVVRKCFLRIRELRASGRRLSNPKMVEANSLEADLKWLVRRSIKTPQHYRTAVGSQEADLQSMLSKSYVECALDASAPRGRAEGDYCRRRRSVRVESTESCGGSSYYSRDLCTCSAD